MQSTLESLDQESELAICEHNRAILDQQIALMRAPSPDYLARLTAIRSEILGKIETLEARLEKRGSSSLDYLSSMEVSI